MRGRTSDSSKPGFFTNTSLLPADLGKNPVSGPHASRTNLLAGLEVEREAIWPEKQS